MKGLCHKCLTSNITIFIRNGITTCDECINGSSQNNKKEKEEKEEKMLEFEDLPKVDLGKRSSKTVKWLENKYNEELLAKFEEDKLHNKN